MYCIKEFDLLSLTLRKVPNWVLEVEEDMLISEQVDRCVGGGGGSGTGSKKGGDRDLEKS